MTITRWNPRAACVGTMAMLALAGSASALPMRAYLNVRTISVDNVGPPAPAANIDRDIEYASQIYRQIGITTLRSSNAVILRNDPNNDGNWSPAEVRTDLLDQARGSAGELHMYYVRQYNNGADFGEAWSIEDVGAARHGAVVAPDRRVDTVAHEGGHVLVDRWKWRNGERSAANGFHSNDAADLMATGGIRTIPTALNEVSPYSNADRIGRNVGPRSNDATVAQPQISAMYFNSGLVNITRRDSVNLRVGPTGGAEVSTGQIPWAQTTTIAAAGRNITIDTSARQIGNNQEEYTLYFRADAAFAGLAAGQRTTFSIFDLASVDIPFTDFLIGGTTEVRTFADVVDPAGGGTGTLLTFGPGGDYTRGSVFSGGVLNNLMINIKNEQLNGVRDVWVTFRMQVPAPSSIGLLALSGLLAARRRRG